MNWRIEPPNEHLHNELIGRYNILFENHRRNKSRRNKKLLEAFKIFHGKMFDFIEKRAVSNPFEFLGKIIQANGIEIVGHGSIYAEGWTAYFSLDTQAMRITTVGFSHHDDDPSLKLGSTHVKS